ncbi:transporter substrate-binding domain-containing protein [Rubrivivax rivuli]|nr:transporter substrate-binding domain-containing protein [Rubrivivax rivuli]
MKKPTLQTLRAWIALCAPALALALAGLAASTAASAQTPPAGGDLPVGAVTSTAAAGKADVAPVMRPPAVDTLATIRRRGVLRVGVITVEPMVMRSASGELSGYSIDLMRRMAQEMGVAVEFIETKSLFMMQELLDGRFDLLATGLWMTTERAMIINFSEPTASEGVHLVANKARAGKRLQLADYNQPEVKIAVYSNTAQEKLARRVFPKAQVVRVDGNELLPVIQGAVHAALVPTLAPASLLTRAPEKLFLPRGEQAVSHTPVALGLRKGDPDFLNFLNTWLSLRRGEGWLEERAAFWAAQAPQTPQAR